MIESAKRLLKGTKKAPKGGAIVSAAQRAC